MVLLSDVLQKYPPVLVGEILAETRALLPIFRYPVTCLKVKTLVTQSRLTLCDPMCCSPPGSSVNGILQERILEWVAIHFSR